MAWDGDWLYSSGGLLGHFGASTVLAVATPGDHVPVHLLPDIAGGKKTPGGANAWVGELVEGVEDRPVMLERNEGAGGGESDVTQDPDVIKTDQLQLERGGVGRFHGRARALGSGNGGPSRGQTP